MKPLMVGLLSLSVWAIEVVPVEAAWNNVFQPTLFGRCRQRPQTSKYVAPVIVQSSPVVVAPACNTCNSPPPPCAPQCSTSYVQRCYYQPVTTYETKSYYEQVTTHRTEYYYEPVTSYRYSCYVDPCTGCPQQVAVPTVSYQLRSKSCPVTQWVQRCAQVPVTVMQKACYWQPQTTCCQTTVGALIPINGAPPIGTPPVINPNGGPPSIRPSTDSPPVIDGQKGPGVDKYYPPLDNKGMSWQPERTTSLPKGNPPPPPVKLDRIIVGPDATVEGQVVRSDNTPRPNAKVTFVNVNQPIVRQDVTANTAGRFQVSLTPGSYHVYLQGLDGTTTYHSRIDVAETQKAPITLVNR